MFKNEHKKKLIYFTLVSVFIIISLATLITSTINIRNENYNEDNFIIETKNNWIITNENTAKLTINRNTNANLLFKYNSSFNYSEIYLGNKLIYTTTDNDLDSCNYTYWINVNPNISKNITIKTLNKEALLEITNANSYLGTYNAVIIEFLSESIFFIIFVSFATLVCIALLIINTSYRFKNQFKTFFNSNYLSLLILCAGLYILTDSQLLSILANSQNIVSILNLISITLLCPFILKYISGFLKKDYYIIDLINLCAYLLLSLMLILYNFNIIELYRYLAIIHIIIVVCAITVFYIIIREYLESKNTILLIILLGLCILFIGSVFTVVIYYYIPSGLYDIFFTFAIFFFIISLIFALIYSINKQNEMLRNESINAKRIAEETTIELTDIKNNIINGISNNIRGPVNEIVGYTNIALNNEGNNTKYLNIVKENARILDNVIDDISDLLTIDDSIQYSSENTDILAYFEVLSKSLKNICENNHITFYSDIINTKNRFVKISKNSIDKVINHLLTNSLKYVDESSSISFILRESETDKKGYTHLSFALSDDGKGMNDKFKEIAFKNFSKENIISKKPTKNSGLELSLAKNIVEKIGGSILLDSANEKGTSIRIEMDVEICNQNIDFEEYKDLNNKNILIVDSDYQNLEVIKSYLKDVNCKVEIFTNTSSVTELLNDSKSNVYDAIITEIDMPILSGSDMAKSIRKFGYTKIAYMPIIGIGYTNNVIECLHNKDNSFNDCLYKPINQKELLDKLSQHIKK